MSTHRLRDYLTHISQAADRIQAYARDHDQSSFETSELVQDGVIRNIEVIGEASRRIQSAFPDFAAAHPELPLAAAYQMRNAVAHDYFAIDLGILWSTVRLDIPLLAETVSALLRESPDVDRGE